MTVSNRKIRNPKSRSHLIGANEPPSTLATIMRTFIYRSGYNLLVTVFSTACFLHNPASAEAYCSAAHQRSNLWRRDGAVAKVTNWIPCQEARISLSEHVDDHRVSTTSLRAGGGAESSSEPFWTKQLARECFAEMVGTAMIVGLGTGAVMSAIFTSSLVGLFQIASVWIIAVTLAIATTGTVSGAHLNPAISVSFAWLRPSKSFGWNKVLPYCMAQLVGSVVASATNFLLYATKIKEFEKINQIARGTVESIASAKAFGQYFESLPTNTMGLLTAFSAEVLGTAILAFVIFALTNEKNDTVKNKVFIPPLIGATVGALIAVIAPITQAGMNPARDFGPRIVAWLAGWKSVALEGWWVYAVAPFVGAPVGAFVADKLLYGDDE